MDENRDMKELLAELGKVSQQVSIAHARMRELSSSRDRLVQAAVEAGATITQVADAAQIARPSVYKILHRK